MESNNEFHTVRGYEILKKSKKNLTPSMEDYLEMIYRSCSAEGYARINQLAEQLNVKASSASKVVQKLAQMGYLAYEKYGIIQMTRKGKTLGSFLLKRHKTVEKFLTNLGVKDTVLADTEMIEHHISMDTLEKIEILNDFLNANPEIAEKLRQFDKNCNNDENDYKIT
ncbi:MAG: transcriptional regulator MntR [Tepidanaerobacteraceae bacterium]|jgi:Mn-dependent DtxR family transcriptional regulator|nr:transcriptional regulator MntR [Tepidanaerobacteraceae bacterium]